MERISQQLLSSDERIRQLQEEVDEKSRSVDLVHIQFQEQQKSAQELKSELDALKIESRNSSFQLEYNIKRVKELESALEKQVQKVLNFLFLVF